MQGDIPEYEDGWGKLTPEERIDFYKSCKELYNDDLIKKVSEILTEILARTRVLEWKEIGESMPVSEAAKLQRFVDNPA
eukprot:7557953-Pyramimonas_sp.AAC.1